MKFDELKPILPTQQALKDANYNDAAIHGGKLQRAKQKALSDFERGKISVSVIAVIAFRRINIDSLSCVINYELPRIRETYIHKIGRIGSAGNRNMQFHFATRNSEMSRRIFKGCSASGSQ